MSLGYRKHIYSTQIAGPALTAAAAATCLPATKPTLPANFFENLGQVVWIKAHGAISCAVTTPGTGRFDVRLGGTVIFDTLAMNLNIVAKTNVPFELEIMLTLRAVGSAGNLMGVGRFSSEAVIASPLPSVGGSGVFILPQSAAPAVGGNFDTQVAQQLDCFFTQTVATGSMTLHQFVVESARWE